ncbi:hypothetical protein F2981_16665 [Sinorhizobium meliloti]|nr:hypothetical protein [Sinorhizobium meliloti]
MATAGNIVANPRLSITGDATVFSSAPPVIGAAEAPLAAHYIERAYEIGTGGVALFERIAIPSDPSTRISHIAPMCGLRPARLAVADPGISLHRRDVSRRRRVGRYRAA